MKSTVRIDCYPESALKYRSGYAIVAIDVIRATTLAVTASAAGRRCFPVSSTALAFDMRRQYPDALLAGEMGGIMPPGFDLNNSPAQISERTDIARPLVTLSSSGTRLIANARGADHVYLACFRNSAATALHLLAREHAHVVLIGAGSLHSFREEDRICCAWIAAKLLQAGYAPENPETERAAKRWGAAPARECLVSKSVDYLERSGQLADLRFILSHVDDLRQAFKMKDGEVVMASEPVAGEPVPDSGAARAPQLAWAQ